MRLVRLTAMAACAIGGTMAVGASHAGAGPVLAEQWVFKAGMNGSREVPGPGDVGASGHARITVNAETGEICWELTVRNVQGTVTAAHIHLGDRNEAGDVVQGLTPPVSGTSSGCAINAPLAVALVADSSAYYVNVHSTEFGAGAVRGQLAGPHN